MAGCGAGVVGDWCLWALWPAVFPSAFISTSRVHVCFRPLGYSGAAARVRAASSPAVVCVAAPMCVLTIYFLSPLAVRAQINALQVTRRRV